MRTGSLEDIADSLGKFFRSESELQWWQGLEGKEIYYGGKWCCQEDFDSYKANNCSIQGYFILFFSRSAKVTCTVAHDIYGELLIWVTVSV